MTQTLLNTRFTSLIMLIIFFSIKGYSGSTPFITTWKTDNPGESNNNEIIIPTFPYEIYNYTIDWGDGTPNTVETGRARYTHTNLGTYTISITGNFPRIYINEVEEKNKILSIEQWGDNAWSSIKSAFAHCTNLQGNFTDAPDLSNVVSMRKMFYGAFKFNYHIDNWGRSITPYGSFENAIRFTEEYFTTGTSILASGCTSLTSPLHQETNVSVGTHLSWSPVEFATGYKVTVGTTPGGKDILDAVDAGSAPGYDIPTVLPGNTTIYVTIIPYDSSDEAIGVGCTEEYFTTGDSVPVPECTSLTLPLDGATQVYVGTDLSWSPVPDATGYILTVETFTTGIDILNTFDVGNVTHYDIPADLPENITIYVTIVPYNVGGEATGCIEETFTTGLAGAINPEDFPPKFFTPNNDTTNDHWIVPNPVKNEVLSIFIYDRYGKLLKQISDIAAGWDGTFNGTPLPTDDYWYLITYKNGSVLKGHFSLVR